MSPGRPMCSYHDPKVGAARPFCPPFSLAPGLKCQVTPWGAWVRSAWVAFRPCLHRRLGATAAADRSPAVSPATQLEACSSLMT